MSAKDAFDALMNPNKVFDPIVWAVVYIVTLVRVDDDDPLLGTPYIGQAVRDCATPLEAANFRWSDEKSMALKSEKEFGFLAALKIFGASAFEWQLLASRRGPRSEVQKWADATEIAEISRRGGVLRDMNPRFPIQQTWNRVPGGKAFTFWPAVDAKCAKAWNRFKQAMVEYISVEGSADVPNAFVNCSGYKLGQKVSGIRSRGDFMTGRPDESDRRAWLEALPGWTYNGTATEKFKLELSQRKKAERANESKEAYDERISKMKLTLATPEVKQKKSDNAKRQMSTVEARDAQSKRSIEMWNADTEEERKQRIDKLKLGNATPEAKQNRSAAMRIVQNNSNIRAKISKTRKENHAVKQRERLLKAREEALPWEYKMSNRVKGAHYRHPDGTIRVCQSSHGGMMTNLGPAEDV